jgi:hypothetical protein
VAKVDKLVEQAREHLDPGEEILRSILGTYEAKRLGQDSVRNGVLMATDHRLVFYAKKLGGYELESFPYHHISSFESGKNLMGHTVKMFASGNEVQVKWMKSDVAALVAIVREKMHSASQSSAPTSAGPATADDPAASLKRLQALHEQELISAEEYEAKRGEILARL